ncbi:MAG TPA: hypothetical protein VKE69_01515 [Planctomycetota bacterium]|nr:hypothetical protein [Planctomycetota bacterium]
MTLHPRTCLDVSEWLTHSAVGGLSTPEPVGVAEHLRSCVRCREEGIATGEIVASLRAANGRIGLPSPRFARSLRERIEAEGAISSVLPGTSASEVNVLAAPARSRSRRRWVGAALAVSIAINVGLAFFVSRRAPQGTAELASVDVARTIVAPALERLRALQDEGGLIAGDVVATGWWLEAEAAASRGGEASTADVRARIDRARLALASEPSVVLSSAPEAALGRRLAAETSEPRERARRQSRGQETIGLKPSGSKQAARGFDLASPNAQPSLAARLDHPAGSPRGEALRAWAAATLLR